MKILHNVKEKISQAHSAWTHIHPVNKLFYTWCWRHPWYIDIVVVVVAKCLPLMPTTCVLLFVIENFLSFFFRLFSFFLVRYFHFFGNVSLVCHVRFSFVGMISSKPSVGSVRLRIREHFCQNIISDPFFLRTPIIFVASSNAHLAHGCKGPYETIFAYEHPFHSFFLSLFIICFPHFLLAYRWY